MTRKEPIAKPDFGRPAAPSVISEDLLKTAPIIPTFPGHISPGFEESSSFKELQPNSELKSDENEDTDEDDSSYNDPDKNGILDILKLHQGIVLKILL